MAGLCSLVSWCALRSTHDDRNQLVLTCARAGQYGLIQEILDAMQTNSGRPRIVGVVVQAADDLSKQGVVEEDSGGGYYKVRWEDGTLSDWLFPNDIAVPLQKEVKGTVLEFNDEGAAKIDFGKGRKGVVVPKDQFYRLYPLPSERDTPIQRQVKLGRLRRCDVTALVMYTGECSCGVRELTCTRACIL